MTSLEFRVLGPLQVLRGGNEIPVRRGKQRLLLAMLLTAHRRVVPIERLVRGLWADDPPDTAIKALQTYVSQLRALLEPGRGAGSQGELLATHQAGYRLGAADEEVDARRFERLVKSGSGLARTDPAAARDALAEGLRLWRGPALVDFSGASFAESEIARLEELRLTAVEQRIAADLALGRNELVIAELRELVRHHPLRETLWEHLMLALYRGGRQSEALRAYQDARRLLSEQLGLAPGPALKRIQERILAQDPVLDSPPAPAVPPVSPIPPRAAGPPHETAGKPVDKPAPDPSSPGLVAAGLLVRGPADGAVLDGGVRRSARGGRRNGVPAPARREEPVAAGQTERRRATVIHVGVGRPEADHRVLSGVGTLLGALRREVNRFGGTVTEATGGSLKAVFGAPVTHEDDAERAVRASLAVRDRVLGFVDAAGWDGVRVGVDTGEVDAGPRENAYRVSGAAVTSAGRLVGRAAAGQVLVSAATYEATRRVVRYAAVPDPDAVQDVWRVVEVASEPSRRPLSTTPLVGRTTEVQLLNAVWERVRATRCPHMVTIAGPPGIGKSRLVGELVGNLTDAVVLRSRCLPYGDAVFGPLAQLVRQVIGVSENDSIRTVRWRLVDWLEAHLPEEERPRVDEYLVTVLSLLGDIIEQRKSTILLLRRFVEVLAADRPTVLVLDDVHWAHAETLDAIETLAARVRSVPLLIVVVGRPELFCARPGWGGGLPSHTSLPLEALSAGHSRELAGLLLDRRRDNLGEARAIEAAAGGNPLFLEELAAWIGDGHTVSADMPATVRAVIGARLDTLPAAERRVIVDAAAIGHIFWAGVLAHLGSAAAEELPEILDDLEMRGLIVRRPESAIGDDPGWAFRHDLIAESAYDVIPPRERAARHLSIARFLESNYELEPAPAVLAHHWKEAGDIERAVTCLVEAAELANGGWERDRAVALFQQAMDLVADTDKARWRTINLRRAVALQAWAHSVMDFDPSQVISRAE